MPRSFLALATLALWLSGCATDTELQTQALTVSPEVLAARQVQMRSYDTQNQPRLFSASAQLLQDLGFTIGETNAATGLLVASKDRSAIEAQQVAGQVMLVLLGAALGVAVDPTYEHNQKIRVLVVTAASHDGNRATVRVTFQRVIWNNHGLISRQVTITDPALYQAFFEKLSKSVFLTGNAI
jgi:hypothetical protein